MNQQFHNKQQSLTITDKQAGVGKIFDWSIKKKIKYTKSYKISFKALPVKIHPSKNQQGRGGRYGQIGLNRGLNYHKPNIDNNMPGNNTNRVSVDLS